MDVTPLIPTGQQVIQSYSENGFKISGERYQQAVIVTAQKTILWTDKSALAELTINDFEALFADTNQYDVYLLGTGKTGMFPETFLIKSLKENSIRLDAMDTGAACRTYNGLMAEGRRVAALLLPL